jgi:hypothetical protein
LPDGFKFHVAPDTVIVAVEASRTEKQAEADLSQATPVAATPAPEPTA